MEKYDDCDWHEGGDEFPQDLEPEYGATHIAMFLLWCIESGFVSEEFKENNKEMLNTLVLSESNYVDMFFKCCDGKLLDSDLNEKGNAFAHDCYDSYLGDYGGVFRGKDRSEYYTEPNWDNYKRIKKLLDEKYIKWAKSPLTKAKKFFKNLFHKKKP